MKNPIYIIIILLLILQWSCNTKKENNGKLEFISVDRIKAKRLIDRFDEKKGYYYGEPVLVKNPPKDIGYAIENMMIGYIEKFGIDFNKKNIKEYRLSFYKYNSDTEVYLTQDYRNTWNGVTDPADIRFTTMDPMAEKYYSISPYVYVANNPMKFIDPTGMNLSTDVKKNDDEHIL